MDNNALILAIVVALVGAIAPTMVSWNTLQQAKETLRQSRENAKKTDENTALTADTNKKVDEVATKTEEIHTATNGTLSKFEERVDMQTKEINELRVVIKTLAEREAAAAPVRATAVRQTGELLKEVGNGNTASYDKLIEEVAELKKILSGFAEKGMPVVAPEDAPLPVKVEVVSKK